MLLPIIDDHKYAAIGEPSHRVLQVSGVTAIPDIRAGLGHNQITSQGGACVSVPVPTDVVIGAPTIVEHRQRNVLAHYNM